MSQYVVKFMERLFRLIAVSLRAKLKPVKTAPIITKVIPAITLLIL